VEDTSEPVRHEADEAVQPNVSFTIKEIIRATGAVCCTEEVARGAPGSVSGVSIDSRTTSGGELFVALKGASFDGHDFVQQALSRGAPAAMVSDEWLASEDGKKCKGFLLAVRDTLDAFQELGRYNRIRVNPRVIAVTGSNGKTTTKDMIAAVSSTKYRTARTEGNYNNQFGVPITLLQLQPGVEAAVVELGMNHPGEIRHLAGLCMPSIGVITNVAPAHLEGTGTVRDVARAKSELAEDLGRDDWLIIHRDSEELYNMNRSRRCKVLTFGLSQDADLFPENIHCAATGETELAVSGFPPVRLSLLGKQNALNALAALAASRVLEVSPETAVGALGTLRPAPGRMEIRTIGPATFIDDSYNANPASTKMALETLFSLGGFERRMAVLGDMLELGKSSEKWHTEVGREAGRANAIFLCGSFAGAVRKGAEEAGAEATNIHILETHVEIAEEIASKWRRGDLFLVKGSRGAAMERVLIELEKRAGETSGSRATSSRREQ
jgi:UDP-N-acetylmuramoyl-tripeptide--D-alanyl-D-alanine ligase